MNKELKCQNCKHYYSFFKQTKDERGMPDFTSIPKCRHNHKILPDGTPSCPDCFEPRNI